MKRAKQVGNPLLHSVDLWFRQYSLASTFVDSIKITVARLQRFYEYSVIGKCAFLNARIRGST